MIAQIVINDVTYEIPQIFNMTLDRELIGTRERTADGTMLMNINAIKRTWVYETRVLSLAEAKAFIEPLEGIQFTRVAFMNDEMNSPVYVYVDVEIERDLDSNSAKDKGRTTRIIITER